MEITSKKQEMQQKKTETRKRNKLRNKNRQLYERRQRESRGVRASVAVIVVIVPGKCKQVIPFSRKHKGRLTWASSGV